MNELTRESELKIEKCHAESFILRMLESPVQCDETGGITDDYIARNLDIYLEWDKSQYLAIIEDLKEEGYIFQTDDGHILLNFSSIYPNASVMWDTHLNECLNQSLKIKNTKLSYLKNIEDVTLRRIIDKMLGYVEDIENVSELELAYPTEHLSGYNELSEATGIIGDEYRIIKKTMWYSILSTKIADKKLRLGRINTDGRFSMLIVLGSGKGKSEFKSVLKDVIKEIKISRDSDDGKTIERKVKCEELSSYHPDQFIGKVKVRSYKKEKIVEPIKGFLSLDYLIIDEALDLLKAFEPVYSESRRALRLGADGKEIYKKNVDAHLSEALKYKTKCVFCLFAQPKSLFSDFVLDGDARRFAIAYVNLHGVNQDEARKRNITDSEIDEESQIKDLINIYNNLNVPNKFTVADTAKQIFEELYELLYQRGMTHSYKIADYTEINKFTIANMLLKMSAIQSLQESSNIITSKHIELAFMDYCEILEHTYKYIHTRVTGNLNYEEKWQGSDGKDQEVLEWLHGKGATSIETSEISIADYKDKIIKIFDVKDRRAADIVSKHRSNEWVESKQYKHSSKIWIKFIPDARVARIAEMQSRAYKKLQDKYYEILNNYVTNNGENYNPTLQPCNHCNPEDEILEKIQKDLEMETYIEQRNRKSPEYLINAYEHDIRDIELEISELSDITSEQGIRLSKTHQAYSKALAKLKNNINKPIIIAYPPFTMQERSSEKMNELLSNG